MKTILVTGAAGQVGSRLVRQLLDRDYEVRALVLPDDPARDRLDGLDIEIFEGNLLDTDTADSAVIGVHRIVHCANLVSPLLEMTQEEFFDNNVRATFNMAQAAADHDDTVERVVSVSSSSVYPNDSQVLACAYHPVDELHPKRPNGIYPLTKLIGEDIVRTLGRTADLEIAIIRPAGIVSMTDILSRWTVGFVSTILKVGVTTPGSEMYMEDAGEPWEELQAAADDADQPCAVTGPDGHPWMYQLVDARDVARGAICALEHPAAAGEAFNIAAPQPISFVHGAGVLAEATGREVIEWQAPVRWVFDLDITKARTLIGYEPQWGVEEMIADAIAVQNGESDGMTDRAVR